MRKMLLDRSETGIFSDQQLELVLQGEKLAPFIENSFGRDSFGAQLASKSQNYADEFRETLVEALFQQYGDLPMHSSVQENLEALRSSSTFTVTTGHQMSLLTGPLYFIVKIAEVVQMSNQLNESLEGKKVIPIFWMASEDHDYEEIQSTNIFGKNLEVDYGQRGPVGRFDTTVLSELKEEVSGMFREEQLEEISQVLSSYHGESLANATRSLVNELFGDYGLVILDGDDPKLKARFQEIAKKELLEGFVERSVHRTNKDLEQVGIKPQVFVRDINLFYIENGIRERIQWKNDGYLIRGIGSFTQDRILKELDENPERFSPNALIRPMYQETILPNVCYVGGAGELNYWLQLKTSFESIGLAFPLIKLRNSVMIIDGATMKKMDKIKADIKDVFKEQELWKKEYLAMNAQEDIDTSSLDNVVKTFKEELSIVLDLNSPYAQSELRKMEKQLEGIKSKVVREAKSKNEGAMKAIEAIKSRLFPDGGLQERQSNILSFCADGRVKMKIDQILQSIDPFQSGLIVLMDDNKIKG